VRYVQPHTGRSPTCNEPRVSWLEASEPDALTKDPEIEEMVSAVTLSRMTADLSTLVGLRTRNSCSTSTSLTQGIGAARAHVRTQFRAIPLSTAGDAFTSSSCGSRRQRQWIAGVARDGGGAGDGGAGLPRHRRVRHLHR
jgi:hypothetical protein